MTHPETLGYPPVWYDSFRAIAKGGCNVFDVAAQHAMLFTYLDDSSDERREKYFACGGLIGGDNQWETFDLEWVSATNELTEPFRATECECGHGQFEDESKWPKPKRDALMGSLVRLIERYLLSGFASIVPVEDYRAVFPDSKLYDPYYLAVRHAFINLAHIGRETNERVKIWCEDSTSTSGTTLDIYNKIRQINWPPAKTLSGITFSNKNLCPLQAADLVAREAFKHIDNIGIRPTRIPIKRLQRRTSFILWTRETLQRLKDKGGPDDYALLTNWAGDSEVVPPMTVFWRDFDSPFSFRQ